MTDRRPIIQDARISVRVSGEVKRRATEAARRKGMSLSEAIREFLRELAAMEDPFKGSQEIARELEKLDDEALAQVIEKIYQELRREQESGE